MPSANFKDFKPCSANILGMTSELILLNFSFNALVCFSDTSICICSSCIWLICTDKESKSVDSNSFDLSSSNSIPFPLLIIILSDWDRMLLDNT